MLDPTKPVKTRDGHKAKIICTDFKGNDALSAKPILAVIERMYGAQSVVSYPLSGVHGGPKENDLVNIPIEQVMYGIVVDSGFGTGIYYSAETRDRSYASTLACNPSARKVKVLVKEIE